MGLTFNKDLKDAQHVEQEVIGKFIGSGYTATSTASLVEFSGYDVSVDNWGTIEVKYDKMVCKTDNVAVELCKYDFNNKRVASGLSATTADYQVYKCYNKHYIIPTEQLKNWIRELKENGRLKRVRGGDNYNSDLALIPYYSFKRKCELL